MKGVSQRKLKMPINHTSCRLEIVGIIKDAIQVYWRQ